MEKLEQFMIDDNGLLCVLIDGTEEYACVGLPCKEGEEQEVWDSIPDGTVITYPE